MGEDTKKPNSPRRVLWVKAFIGEIRKLDILD